MYKNEQHGDESILGRVAQIFMKIGVLSSNLHHITLNQQFLLFLYHFLKD